MRVLIIGLGPTGLKHAIAYHEDATSEIIGLIETRAPDMPEELQTYPLIPSVAEGLALRPDLVVVASSGERAIELAARAVRAGAHVFVENPLASLNANAQHALAVAI